MYKSSLEYVKPELSLNSEPKPIVSTSAPAIGNNNVSRCLSILTQENSYGCGLYAVANALNLKSFVTEERLEYSKKGIGNGKLNQFLVEDGFDFFIDVIYCDTQRNALPENWCGIYSEHKGTCLPILIQCKINDKFHLMGAKLLNEAGKIELFDSLKSEPILCTLSDVNKMYEKVHALYSFNRIDNTEYVAI